MLQVQTDSPDDRHVKFLKKNAGQRAELLVFYLKFCARAICQNMYEARLESFQDNSSLDKQRICVNTQLKSSKKAIKIKCVRTEKQFRRSVCNYMRCHCVPFGPFCFLLCNIEMPVGY